MAKATICDKCGKTFDYVNTTKEKGFLVCKEVTVEKTFEFTGHSFGFGQHRDLKSFDLCPNCIDDVVEFVSENKTERTCTMRESRDVGIEIDPLTGWSCSRCGELVFGEDVRWNDMNFCPNCGAEIVEWKN